MTSRWAGPQSTINKGWNLLRKGLGIEEEATVGSQGVHYLGCKHIQDTPTYFYCSFFLSKNLQFQYTIHRSNTYVDVDVDSIVTPTCPDFHLDHTIINMQGPWTMQCAHSNIFILKCLVVTF